ncbi:MAG: glycosyltransferase [Planctomycetes bacterium]|nr:glycosyltransferase [Planctomycetota bacterium]MCW8136788.1 glycosyltransferase [Planctomycetota bacterium]
MDRRIAIVTPSVLTRGGTEVYLQRLIGVQQRLGLEVRLFTQDAPGSVREFQGVPVQPCGRTLSEAMSPIGWFQRASAVRELAHEVAAFAGRVEYHRLAPLDLMSALKGKLRQVVFVHTPELTCPALGRYLPRSGQPCHRNPGIGCIGVHAFEGCMSLPDGTAFPMQQRLRAFTRGPVTRTIAEIADLVVFNSASMRDLFLGTIGAATNAALLHPPLVAQQVAAQRIPSRLLYVGRLSRPKGVRDAVLAAARMAGSELHLHGEGEEQPALEDLASRHGVNAVFHGHSDQHALARAYAEASCLLLPSGLYETWGMVGPEAIAAGCPVAAYDTGGVREWLGLQFGQAVPVGDVDALAAAAQSQSARTIDATKWHEEAHRRWGLEAFERGYLRTFVSLPPKAKVVHIQRKPGMGHHSMEVLFEQVRAASEPDLKPRVAVCPHPSRGLIPRLRALAWARGLKADLYHIAGDVHFLALTLPGARTVLTVHDCGVLRGKSGLRRWLLRKLWFSLPAARVAAISTISAFSRDELATVAGVPADAITVVPNCANPEFAPDPAARATAPTLLLVGTAANKNLSRTLPALHGLDVKVMVVGRLDDGQERLARGLDLQAIENLDASSMAALYRRAWALMFASTYEGFGMPIIEAQACGTPVVTSQVMPMSEVAGGAALLVDPNDTGAIREAVARVLNDAGLRRDLSEKGLANAARFTPQATAAAYAALYRSVLEKVGREG